MNINNWSGKKKVFALFGALLVVVGIIVTILLVQRQQEIRSRAEKSTTLTLAPPNQNVNAGDDATLEVSLNPGVNQVNFVKFVLNFDSTKFSADANSFILDSSTDFKIINGPVVGQGTFAIVFTTGNDPTKVVRTPQKLGTLKFHVKDVADPGASQVSFDSAQTQVRSIEAADSFNENVLSSATPATITISAVCRPNISTCSWDPVDGASTYHYVITDVDAGKVFSEGDTSNTQVDFTSEPGKTYKCEVTPANSCGGKGSSGEGTNTCVIPSETPTPAPSASPTPGPSSTPTPTVTPPPSATPTPGPSATPTPTTPPGSSATPTPTLPPGVSATPTPAQIASGVSATPTPASALPPTGSPFVIGGIIGGILVLLGGLALLLL